MAWGALHPQFREVKVPSHRDQLDVGLFLLKPFTIVAGVGNGLVGQARRAWDRQGSPQPLLPSPCVCVGSSSSTCCQEVFFSGSSLPRQKLIAEGLRSHLCF